MTSNVAMLEIVAEGLGKTLPDCVFIGGAITALYIDSEGAPTPRPTDDVDCILEIAGHNDYKELQEKLRKLGFAHDKRPKAPICRWLYKGLTVDVMPTDKKILGFTNRWYSEGIVNAITHVLPSGQRILILALPYFIGTKLEAYLSRGQEDPRTSSDIEDICYVIDGCKDPIKQINSASTELKKYLSTTLKKLSQDRDFNDAIEGHLLSEGPGRVQRLKKVIQDLI